jgi:hypothetical protein
MKRVGSPSGFLRVLRVLYGSKVLTAEGAENAENAEMFAHSKCGMSDIDGADSGASPLFLCLCSS